MKFETIDNITYGRETILQVAPSIVPLLTHHWNELAKNRDTIPLDPDYPAYATLEEAGRLRIFTAREDGGLIGYAIYLVCNRHLHYAARWAVSDIFWLSPVSRGAGLGSSLFRYVERQLSEEGINVMHTVMKCDNPDAGVMLERLGHKKIEYAFSKLLNAPGDVS